MQLGLPFTADGDNAIAPSRLVDASILAPIYFVRHRRARRYLLRVESDGRVRVTIPRGGSRREADAFAQRHADWVHRQRAVLGRSRFSADDRQRLRSQAALELPARLHQLGEQLGLRVSRITIRDQRTRWGSCGPDGHICLNWRLMAMPDWVREYVMIHELMHLKRLDHSVAYWRLVARAFPRFREARAWLRMHGPELR